MGVTDAQASSLMFQLFHHDGQSIWGIGGIVPWTLHAPSSGLFLATDLAISICLASVSVGVNLAAF